MFRTQTPGGFAALLFAFVLAMTWTGSSHTKPFPSGVQLVANEAAHRVDVLIDGQPFLTYEDKSPLEGPGHEYFGFDNWESDAWFDDLVITPL